MTNRTPSAGDILDARCTRCHTLTNHTIVALVGGRVARVKCNTCASEHNFHPPKEESPPKTRRATVPRGERPASTGAGKAPAPSPQEQWASLLAGRDTASAPAYAMDGKYASGTLVSHPVFGVGIVTSVTVNKMEVRFRDGLKLLRCGK
jgi:hypothetical protein